MSNYGILIERYLYFTDFYTIHQISNWTHATIQLQNYNKQQSWTKKLEVKI